MTFRLSLIIASLLLLSFWIHPGSWTGNNDPDLPSAREALINNMIREKYLSLNDSALNPDAFHLGMLGYRSLLSRGLARNDSLLTIIDFSRPSCVDRFFVINLTSSIVIFKSLVSHGRNSGDLYARKFSNKIQSHQSALGFYLTGEPYRGGQGYSLQLNGVDSGYNDLSKIRGIVIHAAGYATQEYIDQYGRLGRSFGCPALPPGLSTSIINTIKGGSVVFSYFPDQAYLRNSVILHSLQDEPVSQPGGI